MWQRTVANVAMVRVPMHSFGRRRVALCGPRAASLLLAKSRVSTLEQNEGGEGGEGVSDVWPGMQTSRLDFSRRSGSAENARGRSGGVARRGAAVGLAGLGLLARPEQGVEDASCRSCSDVGH